jgi:uncharacterized protein (DUF3084 family)
MTEQTDAWPEPREELRRIDEDLARLREQIGELRSGIGDRSNGPGDAGDGAALLQQQDELQALVDTLEQRRERLSTDQG